MGIEDQVRELLDKQAIYELVHAYARAADRKDHEAMRSLYHSDAIDEHGRFSRGPALDFIDKLPEIQAPMRILQHHVTTLNIQLAGDYAEGEAYVTAFHQVEGVGDLVVNGRYLDKYSRRDGGWKFSHRVIVADWAYTAEPSAVALDHPFMTGSHIGRSDAGDLSYQFFTLFRRGQR